VSDDGSAPTGAELLARNTALGLITTACAAAGLDMAGVYVVGGVVRDAVRGTVAQRDIDLAVEGAGIGFAHLLASALGGEVIAEHPFGTATVVALIGDAHVRIDIASCRTERYPEPGSLPVVQLDAAIDADLARRDVTANAIAIALAPDEHGVHRIVDPHGGIADVEARVLRVLHDESFRDDPTRVFRVARYAGRLGFRVDEHTRELAIAAIDGGALATMSADRVRAELELVLQEHAWAALTFLASWGVTGRLDPRLEDGFQRPYLIKTIDDASGIDPFLSERVWTLRLAALARGLGDDVGGWLRWLGFPGEVVHAVSEHVHVLREVLEHGDALAQLPNSELYLRLGEVSDDSFALAALATPEERVLPLRLEAYRRAIRTAQLTVRGEDVMAEGVPAGPAVGRILGDLFLRSLDGEFADEQAERAALAELARAHREDPR
jgi:tRNA nucleotidyltransferase (CCA-adding enzyme)